MKMNYSHSDRIHKLKQQALLGITCCLMSVAAWLAAPTMLAAQAADAGVTTTIVDSSARSVTVKFALADYEIETVAHDGLVYQRIRIGNLPQSIDKTLPQVPIHGILVGLPTTDGIEIEILEADYRDLHGYDFMPAPVWVLDEGDFEVLGDEILQEGFTRQASWKGYRGFLPAAPAALAKSGYMRGQPVGQIQFYPVAYNPATRTARIYRTITARISWNGYATDGGAARRYSAAFEPVLQSALINYADLAPARTLSANDEQDIAARRAVVSAKDAATRAARLAKIVVDQDGMYRIRYEDLLDNGIPATQLGQLDPLDLAITNQGTPVAIELQGMDDGKFEPGDAIIFYGAKIQRDPFGLQMKPCGQFAQPAPDYLFTYENVYWLKEDRNSAIRMDAIAVEQPPADAQFPSSFTVTRHFEQDDRYWQTMLSQKCADRWFWQSRIGNPASTDPDIPLKREYALDLEGKVSSDDDSATLTINMAGYTSDGHPYRISVDAVELSTESWSGQSPITRIHTIESGQLAGRSTLNVSVEAGSLGPQRSNQFLVNWMQLEFNQAYSTSTDLLYFSNSSAGNALKVDGFASPAIVLYDISNPIAPVRLNGGQTRTGSSPHALSFIDAREGLQGTRRCQNIRVTGRCYLALANDRYVHPKSINAYSDPGTDLREANAQYVIITHPTFQSAAEDLAAYRRTNDGLTTAVVYVDDIFTEFGDGIANPKAIRDFLEYGYRCWQNSPEYVLLMGDASQDGRDIYGFGNNYVPTHLFESTLFGEVASDNWFALMADSAKNDCETISEDNAQDTRDTLPDLFLGRIPVSTLAEAQVVVDKIKAYETTEWNEPWKEQMLYVADDEDKFATTLNLLEKTTASYMNIQRMDTPNNASNQQPHAMAERIAEAINAGKVIVGYVGHGDYNGWGRWDADHKPEYYYIFHVDHVEQLLRNAGQLPFVMVGNCLNGFFAGPTLRPAMAEVLLHAVDKGAVGVWAPTGLGYPSGHRVLLNAFNNATFTKSQRRLGVITNTAYAETYATNAFWEELTWTYVLFGDPYMELSIPRRVYMPIIETRP